MELLDISLRKMLNHKVDEQPLQLDTIETRKMLEQIGSVLAWMHHHGVVHHDVKSDNIMIHPFNHDDDIHVRLKQDQTVFKLIDHGLDHYYPGLTDTTLEKRLFSGTKEYLSPKKRLKQVSVQWWFDC